MADRCRHEQSVFLMTQGHAGLLETVRAALHYAVCPRCRRSVRHLAATSRRLRALAGGASLALLWLPRLGWTAAALLVTVGLYALGVGAVRAAMASLDRPQVRQATFSEDNQPRRPHRQPD
jgi:hypothetical protein